MKTIQYFEPLSRAWNNMIKALFKPFNMEKWLTVGFTAFLANLLSGGRSFNFNQRTSSSDFIQSTDPSLWLDHIANWIDENQLIFGLIIGGVVFVIGLIILFAWLSSCGKFMFLDNVIHNRYEVKKPWKEFKDLGFSLFMWRLGYGVIVFLTFAFFITGTIFIAADLYDTGAEMESFIILIVVAILIFLSLIIVVAAISTFLDSFVVPIMYKHQLKTTDAWKKFLSIFKPNIGKFVVYLLVLMLITLIIIAAVVMVGFFTCCIGFIILLIPYLNAVLLLPVSYTLRLYSLEFLAQFGEEFELLPKVEDTLGFK